MIHLLPRLQLRLLQSQLRSNQEEDDEYDDSDVLITELDLHRGYSRPKLETKIYDANDDDEELSDYVLERLRLARERAMEAYRTTQGTA